MTPEQKRAWDEFERIAKQYEDRGLAHFARGLFSLMRKSVDQWLFEHPSDGTEDRVRK